MLDNPAPRVSNSLRAPTPVEPGSPPQKVGLRERQWGTKKPDLDPTVLTTVRKDVLAAAAKSLNEDPEGLKRSDLQAALDAQMGALAKCFDHSDVTSVGIYFEADPSGQARGVRVRGAPAETETCATSVIENLRFPAFKGNPVPIDFPISIRRRVEAVTAPGAKGPE